MRITGADDGHQEADSDRPATAAGRVYRHLKAEILAGSLDADAKLSEDALAALLEVSRTPVREALNRLEADGLVESTPNHGAHVVTWDEHEATHLLVLRSMVEGYAAELCARHATDEVLADLTALVTEMEALAAEPDRPDHRAQLVDLNITFHRTIAQHTGSRLVLQMFSRLLHFPLQFRAMTRYHSDRLRLSMQQHRDLLMALHARDPEWARSVMSAHLLSATTLRYGESHAGDGAVSHPPPLPAADGPRGR